mmetsp:Transcript_5648/g.4428  ORF Transcript_5648/g.4428 Transcript_5648/m.4428 type:complete len:95 (-) Transcript_5648:126-410(-)
MAEASAVEEEFKKIAEEVKAGLPVSKKVPTDRQLMAYKYYKQATEGDVNTERPGMLDFTGKSKWDAWKSVEGVPKETAMQAYIEEINKQKEEFK